MGILDQIMPTAQPEPVAPDLQSLLLQSELARRLMQQPVASAEIAKRNPAAVQPQAPSQPAQPAPEPQSEPQAAIPQPQGMQIPTADKGTVRPPAAMQTQPGQPRADSPYSMANRGFAGAFGDNIRASFGLPDRFSQNLTYKYLADKTGDPAQAAAMIADPTLRAQLIPQIFGSKSQTMNINGRLVQVTSDGKVKELADYSDTNKPQPLHEGEDENGNKIYWGTGKDGRPVIYDKNGAPISGAGSRAPLGVDATRPTGSPAATPAATSSPAAPAAEPPTSNVAPVPAGIVGKDARKAYKVEQAKNIAEGEKALPSALKTASQLTEQIDRVINDPNLGKLSGFFGGGSNAIGLNPYRLDQDVNQLASRLENITSQTFLQGIQSMRGTGPVSNAEGIKATAAASRLQSTTLDEAGKKEALQEYRDSIMGMRDGALVSAGRMPVEHAMERIDARDAIRKAPAAQKEALRQKLTALLAQHGINSEGL